MGAPEVGKWIWALWLLAAMPEFRISPDLISFSFFCLEDFTFFMFKAVRRKS